MQGFTTIQIDRRLLVRLKRMKTHPRQSYNEVISQMLSDDDSLGKFAQAAQMKKMQELWDNKEDEAWEHA